MSLLHLPILKLPSVCGSAEADERSAALVGGSSAAGPKVEGVLRRAPEHVKTLLDSHGRQIRDLRLSITDRCNFRCVYCMEPDVRFADAASLLTPEQFEQAARVCLSLGVTKLRITGGEPTLHPRLTEIITRLSGLNPGDLAMTTNASRCDPASLCEWKAAGLRRLTISIDSLKADRFAQITRSTATPAQVLQTIKDAAVTGFAPVKVNAVIVRGQNDDEVADLAGLARELKIEMRFIEFMPLDAGRAWEPAKLVPGEEILRAIESRYELVAMPKDDASSTADVYRFADGAPGNIGIIAPVTRPFCGSCSRLRITADGKVRPCLFSLQEWDIRGLLRDEQGTEADGRLAQRLIDITYTKQAGHGITSADFTQPQRPMSAIGG